MADVLAPINVATPKWVCPYCGTHYDDNLTCAEKCAALGAPEGAWGGSMTEECTGLGIYNDGVYGATATAALVNAINSLTEETPDA